MKTKYSVGQEMDLKAIIIKIDGTSTLGENNKINNDFIYELKIQVGKDEYRDFKVQEECLDYQYNQGRLVIKDSTK